jgi:phosphoribosyl-AMP cyclohydrolase
MDIEKDELTVADLRFDEKGLIPCIVQDSETGDILMMAWMNEESVRRSLADRTTWFWSRSRNKFWHKGEESGNTQELVELRYDCDADCLLARVIPAGPACHTGERTCFYRAFDLG